MILKNITSQIHVIAGQQLRSERSTFVPDGTVYDKDKFEEVIEPGKTVEGKKEEIKVRKKKYPRRMN